MPGDKPRYIITTIDYATRWPIAHAVKEHKASDVTRFIGTEIVSRFGVPDLPITNGGRELVGGSMKAYLARQGIKHTVTTPYHAQANGQVDRITAFAIIEFLGLVGYG